MGMELEGSKDRRREGDENDVIPGSKHELGFATPARDDAPEAIPGVYLKHPSREPEAFGQIHPHLVACTA